MNKKIIYYITNVTNPSLNGTGNDKINEQVRLFHRNDFSVKYIDVSKGINKWDYRISKLPFVDMETNLKELNDIKSNTGIYIRYFQSNIKLIKYLKKIRQNTRNVKIAIEIPTYPYDGEFKNNGFISAIKRRPILFKDKMTRIYLKKYVDRIVTFSNDKKIWGIKTINISNGINVKEILARNPNTSSKDSINLIAVAKFGFWHGYDRMIVGLGEYYKRSGNHKNIKFYLVGYGDPKIEQEYKTLIKKYHLEKHVILTGKKLGKELDDLYNIADIAIDSMGRHRSGVTYNSTLKGKEYLAKGLPIISGVETELDSMPNFKYYYRVPANDAPINIEKIIYFYDKIYKKESPQIVTNKIRNFCKQYFIFDKVYRKVINWYQE